MATWFHEQNKQPLHPYNHNLEGGENNKSKYEGPNSANWYFFKKQAQERNSKRSWWIFLHESPGIV